MNFAVPIAALLLVAVVDVAGCRSESAVSRESAEPPNLPAKPQKPHEICVASMERAFRGETSRAEVAVSCAPLFARSACADALRQVTAETSFGEGQNFVDVCLKAYCPIREETKICWEIGTITPEAVKRRFPGFVDDVMAMDQPQFKDELRGLGYALSEALAPPVVNGYVRIRAAGDQADIAFGSTGGKDCRVDQSWKVPVAKPIPDQILAEIAAKIPENTDPLLVNMTMDSEPNPTEEQAKQLKPIEESMTKFLIEKRFQFVRCFEQRKNCPILRTCP